METESTGMTWIAKILQKYNFLLFLATTFIPLVLWGVLMLIDFFTGILFRDPNKLGMDLFVAFIFPLITAPIVSGLALLITKLLNIRSIRWLVVIGLGVVIPIGAFLLVLAGHWIARKLYTDNKANLPVVLSGAIATQSKGTANIFIVATPVDKKMEQLKEMLNKGLISKRDYELKKADILAKM